MGISQHYNQGDIYIFMFHLLGLSIAEDVTLMEIDLQTRRYLYASILLIEGTSEQFCGTNVPRGIRNLTGLHALQTVKASKEILCDVAALTELRTFAVSDETSEHYKNC
jgi:hypothetical protein